MKRTLSSLAASAAAVMAIASAVTAQGNKAHSPLPASVDPTQVDRVPVHTAAPDGGIDYGVWAAGSRYKVSFHGDMTFVPYLGMDYPTNRPLSWHTESVTAGGEELLSGGDPKNRHSDYRFEYRHGAVTEAYDIRSEGLEQTFVFHARPATSGDIVVRGAVTTPLKAPQVEASHGALNFVDENGNDVLRYGEAFVLDAAGRKLPITTTFRDGRVELTVPASWLRGATWPVTIDPVLSVTAVGNGGPHRAIDVTRDDDGNDVMVCFCLVASASDQDAFGYMMTDSFAGRTLVYTDLTTAWSTRDVNCATSGFPRRYCIVMSRLFNLPVYAGIRAHLHDSEDWSLSTGVRVVSTTTTAFDSRPDVGGAEPGNTAPFGNTGQNFLIVWQRDSSQSPGNSSIWGRRLSAAGILGPEFPIALPIFGPHDYEYPSLNAQALRSGSKTTWMVTYQDYVSPTWRVEGKLVSDDNVVEPGYAVSNSTYHRVYPKVAGQGGRYLVVFARLPYSLNQFKTPSIAGHRLMSQRVDWNSGGTPSVGTASMVLGYYSNRELLLGGLAYDSNTRSHWVMTTGRYRNVGGDGRVSVVRMGYQGKYLETSVLQTAPTIGHQGVPRGVVFNSDASEFQASWMMADPNTGQARVARYTYDAEPTPTTSGASCSTALPGWSGSQQIGSEFSKMTLGGATPNVAALLVVGTSTVNTSLATFGMPGCQLLVPDSGPGHLAVLFTATGSIGTVSVPLALPEFLGNMPLHYQWFYIDAGSNPMNVVSTMRLDVQLTK